ncbi:MAG: squalene/phytoene synthase family protein [Alphaproteobacteria bacterium]|nr:squalene/phytoene synthase family protein [Alphaproteobacteria bacterium]MCD8520082.1 squalene/phytoene synthase family protein [Alphaproteobacteria bacterium]MCD8571336.1 squalene/phytoene synthase family protein [Alphaproteobacteria bacterium]
MGNTLSYCGALVKDQDHDRFLITLMMPHDRYEALFALFAFNHEIAKTREVVSETQLGLIRLQWWRDQLANIYGGGEVPEHEILQPLSKAIKDHNLTQEYFDRLIYAREFDLEDVLPASVEGLLNYADFTSTPLMKLALQILGEDNPESMAVQPVSVNYALMGIIRAVPFFAGQHRCLLPENLMQKYGVKKLYELKPQGDLPGLIRELSAEFVPDLKPPHKFLKLSNALARMYCKQARACRFDPFHPRLRLPLPFKALRLYFSQFF